MNIDAQYLSDLQDPAGSGVVRIEDFIDRELLSCAQAELHTPRLIPWRDNHETYINQRGLTIVQNHDVYALKLSQGDQSPLEQIPAIVATSKEVERFILRLSEIFPSLVSWEPDELSLHRYDDPDVGLSLHKDNLRFTGVVAIVSLEGECDLVTSSDTYPALPGDLFLLRATGLIDTTADLRPEHSVVNLHTPTRTSMMLRANNRPTEQLDGFEFDNWPASSRSDN